METQPARPNILFLFSDQHNARVLGCYGNDEVHTPNLDQLAREGVRFTNAYCQNPICTPSRMCFFSGQYAHNHGHYGLMGPPPEKLPSMMAHFKKHGYRNGIVGKIHTPTGWMSEGCEFVKDACYHEHPDRHSDYKQYLEQKGLWHLSENPVIPEWKERNQADIGDQASKGNNAGQGLDARASNLAAEDSQEGWIASECMNFLEQSKEDDRPFFLFMSNPKPHQPYLPAKKFWDLYDENNLTLPPNANSNLHERHPDAQKKKEFFQNGDKPYWTIFEPRDFESARKRVLRGYYACVSQVDDTIGQVLSKLEELGLRENTMIVYASDHGDFAGEHGLIEKAPGIGFRATTRIPYIWSWPGFLPENQVCDALTESVDLFPTMCSLAGLPLPKGCDGNDITPLLKGERKEIRQIAVTENVLTKTVHTQKYKYVHYVPEMTEGREHGELYDQERDPWEMNNLYSHPDYAQVVTEMRNQLLNWMITTSRFSTTFPPIPGRPDWERDPEIYGEDGKVGNEVWRELIKQGQTVYL